MKINWKEHLALPKDVTEACEVLRILADQEVFVYNYEKILCCTEEQIQIQCKKRKVTVSGKKLSIPYYDKYQMQIAGGISRIEFEGR